MSQHRKRAKKGGEISKPYEPTPRERDALEAFDARRKETLPSPRLKVQQTEAEAIISPDHQSPQTGQALLMEALGTTDVDFYSGLLNQLTKVARQGSDIDGTLNFMVAVVKGLEPKDQVEAMLGAQMAAIHMATVTLACSLARVENIPQQDSAERALNKLARTFASQIEVLKRYRSGGEQKVTVEHVTVNEGGQAIVGHVRGGGCSENKGSTS